MTYREQLLAAKAEIVRAALSAAGTVSGAARQLKIERSTLHKLMHACSIASPRPARRGVPQ